MDKLFAVFMFVVGLLLLYLTILLQHQFVQMGVCP